MRSTKKAATYTDSQLYTGREVTVRRSGIVEVGRVSNGGQCSDSQFAYSSPDGDEICLARSAIVKLGR